MNISNLVFFLRIAKREGTGACLIVGDKNLEMLENILEVFPAARYQRCTVGSFLQEYIFYYIP